MSTYRQTQFGKVIVVAIGTDEPEVLTAALQEALDSLKPAPE